MATALANATVGVSYSQTITPSGGRTPYAFSIVAGALPTGLSLSSASGSSTSITGTPSGATGTYSITFNATDSYNFSVQKDYTILLGTPTITISPTALASAQVSTPYSQTVTASASSGTYTYVYSISGGALPAGLSINSSTGAITGTPTTAATSSFTVQAQNTQYSLTGTQSYTVVTAALPPTITVSGTLAAGTRGSSYTGSVSASGGTAPYTYAVSSGSLPSGLTMSSSGSITGTIAASLVTGTYTFGVTATDSGSYTGTNSSLSITVNARTLTISGTVPSTGSVGTAYAGATLTASGGTSPYTFNVTSGSLPAGLSLSTAGVISGTPTTTTGSPFNFTVTVTDTYGNTGTASYTITISATALTVTGTVPSTGTVGTAYAGGTVSASGGGSPYTFTKSSGTLPPGLSLSPAGAITGTPTTTTGSPFSFTVTATDTYGNVGSASFSITISSASVTVTGTTPAATLGNSYTGSVSASGGTGTYTYVLASGALPPGLTMSTAGAITGTPTSNAGSPYLFTVTATDSYGNTGTSGSLSITVNQKTLTLTGAGLTGTQGVAVSGATITASGGTSPYTFSLGTLPAGITYSTSTTAITFSGTPTVYGSPTFTVTATDAFNNTITQTFTFVLAATTITLAALSASGTAESALSATMALSGGSGTYTWSYTGTLPSGVTVSLTAGAITFSGTPTTVGTYTGSVTVTDSVYTNATATKTYTIIIAAPTITFTPATLTSQYAETAYSQTITASGGATPYVYTISSGLLPNGLTLSSAGVLSGTPNVAGLFTFTVTATDFYNITAAQAYSLTLISPVITLSAAPTNPVTISASGGIAPYSYAVTTGAMPPGWSFNATTGVMGGTAPDNGGTYNWTITATDAYGFTGVGNYTTTLPSSSGTGGTVTPSTSGGSTTTGTTTSTTGSTSTTTTTTGTTYVSAPTGVGSTVGGVTTITVDVTPTSTGVVPTTQPPPPPPTTTGGGGAFSAGCVVLESFVPEMNEGLLYNGNVIKQAYQLLAGHKILLSDPVTLETRIGEVKEAVIEFQPCYRIVTKKGVSLVASDSAPIPTLESGIMHTTELLGKSVGININGIVSWDEVVQLEAVGMRFVRAIDTRDNCFWAGENGGAYILHHNATITPIGSGTMTLKKV